MQKNRIFLAIMMAFSLLSGCGPRASEPTAAPALTPADLPTATPEPAATSTPAPSPTTEPGGSIITAANAAALTGASAKIASYVQRIAWPGPDRAALQSETGIVFAGLRPLKVESEQPVAVPGRMVALAPDGSAVAAVDDSGKLALYSLDGQPIRAYNTSGASFANFSPDGKWLVAGLRDSIAAEVFAVDREQPAAKLNGFETAAPVYNVYILPGGKTLLWVARATVQFQDVTSGAMGTRLSFEDFVSDIAFSSDGSMVAINGGGAITVYQAPSGEQVTRLTLSQPARSLAFSPDGTLLAAGYGPAVQLWETEKWAPLPPTAAGEGAVTWVSFSPGGHDLITIDENNDMTDWTVP